MDNDAVPTRATPTSRAPAVSQGHDFDTILRALTRDPQLWHCQLNAALNQVLREAQAALHANFASLWQCNTQQSSLDLRLQFDLPSAPSQRLAQQLPDYFAALAHERYIAVTDCHSDARAAALIATYPQLRGVTAMLHLPLWCRGQLWGALCFEHTGAPHMWTADEISFALSIVELLDQLVVHEQVVRNESVYFSLARHASIGLLRIDEHGNVIYCNDCWRAMTGIESPVWRRDMLRHIVHPDDIASVRQQIEEIEAEGSGQLVYRLRNRDGKEIHVVSHVVLEYEIVGHQRVHRGSLTILLDVTHQEQTERAIKKLSIKQQAILNGVARIIFSTDIAGNISIFNHAAETILGYQAQDVVGRNVATLLHDPAELALRADVLSTQLIEPIAPGFEVLVAAARQGLVSESEWTYRCMDGSTVPVSLSMTALRDERHNIIGFVGIANDLREQRRIEALTRSRDRLIQHMLRGLGAKIGEAFFDTLAEELSTALDGCTVQGVELIPGSLPPRGRTMIKMGAARRNVDVALTGTPVLTITALARPQHWRDVQSAFPDCDPLRLYDVHDYMGVPLLASDGSVMGVLVIFSLRQFDDPDFVLQLLQIFSLRAANELERLRHERAMLERNHNQQWILEYSGPLHERNSVKTVGEITARALHAHSSHPRVTVSITCPGGYRVLAHSGGFVRSDDYNRIIPRYKLHDKIRDADHRIIVSRDISSELADAPELLKLLRSRKTAALTFIGLFDGDTEVGIIVLEFSHAEVIDTLDIESLLIYTHSVGLALNKALQQEQLEYQASHDSLTGLFNRAVLHRDFAAWQVSGGQCALLLLDLNRFKEVNDTLGHQIGDHLLRQVGERLQARLDRLDARLYRLGGDEFAIFARGLANATALSLAEDLLAALNQPFALNVVSLEIGGSIGVALYPEHGDDSHALLRSADVAMYKAKQTGIGATLYHRDLDMNSTERLEMLAEFRQGVREQQLVLYYQPKISLVTGATVGFEALVRWQHPRLGLLTPPRFLPLVEMTDAIHDLTYSLLNQACAQLQVWRTTGYRHALSVNLSARNLIDDRVVMQLKILLETYPLARGYLDLEITETALIHEPERALALMQRIAALGITFSIDDFGTGYSSLSYLRKMPISTLKIDRTFIHNMQKNPQDKVIVESTIMLAHNLSLNVVAEGVENEDVLQQLRQMGCNQVQGNLLGEPLPIADFPGWLERSARV